MSPQPNYFYVNRALLQSDRWLSEPFTRGQAWVDLFGLAQHKDSFFRVRGIKVEVKRGQLAYSQLTLAKRWKWSRNKLFRYLNELEKQEDIVQQNSNITTLITIVKYEVWQENCTTNDTPEGQQKDTRRVTYNKENNDNNDKKNTDTSLPFDSFWLLYPKKVERLKAEITWARLSLEVQQKILDDIPRRVLGRQWHEGFIPNPTTYLNGERWNDQIEQIIKKPDSLILQQ